MKFKMASIYIINMYNTTLYIIHPNNEEAEDGHIIKRAKYMDKLIKYV